MQFWRVLRAFFFVFGFLVLGFAQASSLDARWMPWRISWEKTDQENELVMPMVCDDAYYTGLHVVVPGTFDQDFDLEIVSEDGTCRLLSGENSPRSSHENTVLRIENTGQCEITIHQKSGAKRTGRKAQAFLSDAC